MEIARNVFEACWLGVIFIVTPVFLYCAFRYGGNSEENKEKEHGNI